MSHNPEILDRAVRHQQPMFDVKTWPRPWSPIGDLPDELPVFRVRSLDDCFEGGFGSWPVPEDPKALLGPVDLSVGNVPAEAARVAELLRLGQIRLAPPERV